MFRDGSANQLIISFKVLAAVSAMRFRLLRRSKFAQIIRSQAIICLVEHDHVIRDTVIGFSAEIYQLAVNYLRTGDSSPGFGLRLVLKVQALIGSCCSPRGVSIKGQERDLVSLITLRTYCSIRLSTSAMLFSNPPSSSASLSSAAITSISSAFP